MSNYSLVINSKFKPFSYQELLAPALMSTQAHQAVEDAYSELATKANIWDKMTDPGSKAHGMYEAYARDLEQQAEQLSRYGLTPSSRQQMLNMKSRYSSDIVPIEQAYKRREEQAKQQAEIMAKDPTHFFARTASTTSLDDYIANPSLDTISQNYSGALLTQQVSQAAAALAKDARNDPNVRTELRRLLPYQYETIRRTGFDPETVMQAILNSPDANKILTGIVDTAMANSGMNDWNYMSPEDKERVLTQARQYANQGLWSAVGQTQYGSVTDQYGMNVAMENLRHQHAIEEAAAKNNPPDSGSTIRHWSMDVSSSEYLNTATNLYKKMMNNEDKFIQGYSGKNFTNPLKIYNEYRELAKKYSSEQNSGSTITNMFVHRSGQTQALAQSKALNEIKKKYGVNKILEPQEYAALVSIGYNENSKLGDFNNRGFKNRINRAATGYSASSTNLTDYSLAQEAIYPNMRRYYRDSNPGFLYKYTSKGRGKSVSFNDVVSFDDKGKPNINIEDISYSYLSPDDLIVTIGGNDYYMSPEGYGSDLYNIVSAMKGRYFNNLQTDDDKSMYQDLVTTALQKELNRRQQVRGNTSSKI